MIPEFPDLQDVLCTEEFELSVPFEKQAQRIKYHVGAKDEEGR